MDSTAKNEIEREQAVVDAAYSNLDRLRTEFRATQRRAEAQGAWGTPQARTERDVTAAHFGDRAARLERIEDRLVFGRLDDTEGDSMHIGRTGLKDADGVRILTDWRAPAATPFYQATALNPQGIIRRRHISSRNRTVVSLEDELLDPDEADSHNLRFQGEGALMAALGSAREGYMGDIVATIQAEQDHVVRADSKGILVVQGGPGTGKTAVALHRAAYLLYTHRERLERSGVLVVGPTRTFLRYIEQVLPSLGETGVVSVTMADLLPGFSASGSDTPEVAAAKGNLAWVPTLKEAVNRLQRLPSEDIVLDIRGRKATLTLQAIKDARSRARRSGKPHNEAREIFALELVDVVAAELAQGEKDPDTVAWWRDAVRESKDARREINLCWMPTSPTRLLERLYSRPEQLAAVSRGLTARECELVARPAGSEWTTADIPLLDELEELLGQLPAANRSHEARQRRHADEVERAAMAISGQNLGGGIVNAEMLAERARGEDEWKPLSERAREDRAWAYGHIVVDEAQDLTPMMWHSLLRRCPSRSFTVVGDLDQARGKRQDSWFDALGPAAAGLSQECVLTVSYRTPRTLMELAERVQAANGTPIHFPVIAARDVENVLDETQTSPENLRAVTDRVIEAESSHLDEMMGSGAGRIGVIVSDAQAREWELDTSDQDPSRRVSFLTPKDAKGLEFDTTVLVEPSAILRQGPGDLFVAQTRSTQRLHAVHSQALPPGWIGQPTDISARP